MLFPSARTEIVPQSCSESVVVFQAVPSQTASFGTLLSFRSRYPMPMLPFCSGDLHVADIVSNDISQQGNGAGGIVKPECVKNIGERAGGVGHVHAAAVCGNIGILSQFCAGAAILPCTGGAVPAVQVQEILAVLPEQVGRTVGECQLRVVHSTGKHSADWL